MKKVLDVVRHSIVIFRSPETFLPLFATVNFLDDDTIALTDSYKPKNK
jgi:hypothetical protein